MVTEIAYYNTRLNAANDNNHRFEDYQLWEHKNVLRQQRQLLPCQPQHSALYGDHNTDKHMHALLLQTTNTNKTHFQLPNVECSLGLW